MSAGFTWERLEYLSAVTDLCPRCSAVIDHSITVCETHEPADGECPHCNRQYAAHLSSGCTNCFYTLEDQFAVTIILSSVEMLGFLTTHGINPITGHIASVLRSTDEEILSAEPFKARFTFTIDGDTLSLTVDDELSVVDATSSLPETT